MQVVPADGPNAKDRQTRLVSLVVFGDDGDAVLAFQQERRTLSNFVALAWPVRIDGHKKHAKTQKQILHPSLSKQRTPFDPAI